MFLDGIKKCIQGRIILQKYYGSPEDDPFLF